MIGKYILGILTLGFVLLLINSVSADYVYVAYNSNPTMKTNSNSITTFNTDLDYKYIYNPYDYYNYYNYYTYPTYYYPTYYYAYNYVPYFPTQVLLAPINGIYPYTYYYSNTIYYS